MDPAQVEEAVACGLCGDPLIEGANGSLEPRGSYHVGCMRRARQETPGEPYRGGQEYGGGRRRKRRS